MRRLLAVLALAFLAASSVPAQVKKTVLPNGLTVLTKEVHSAPVVSTQVWYRVGSRNERPGITGISHLLEHMMFKGTSHWGSSQFTRIVTSRGGWDNAYTWHDFTAYSSTVPSTFWKSPLHLEADRMVNLSLGPKDFEAERTVVLSELEGDENSPTFYLGQAVRAAAFMAHPYHWQTIGWKSDVKAMTRDDMARHYRTYYAPGNATIAMVGDFDTNAALTTIRNLFGNMPKGPQPPPVTTKEPPQEGQRRVTVKRPGTTGYIEIAFHVPEVTHVDHIPLDVVSNILGQGRTSRLYRALVDKGLATAADAYHYDNADPTLFEISATLKQGVSHEDVEKAVWAEVGAMREQDVSDTELQRAVNQAKASFVFGMDSVSQQSYRLGFYNTIASYEYLDTYLDKIKKVSKEQVRRVAAAYLQEDNSTVGWFAPLPPKPGEAIAPAGPTAPGPSQRRRGSRRVRYPARRTVRRPAQPKPAAAKPAKPSPKKPLPVMKRVVLPNGLVVVVQENHATPAVALSGLMKGGSMYDPPGKEGLSNFTALMLSRGTATRTWQQIAEQLEFVAAEFSAGSGLSQTRMSGRCLKEDLPLLLEIAADELRSPSFPADQVEKVRGEIQTALREAQDDPGEMSERSFYAALYPEGHPFHHLPLGETDAVNSITREDLAGFHSRCYRPDRLSLVLVGDFKADEALALARKYFADWKTEGEAPAYSVPDVPVGKEPVRRRLTIEKKSQTDIALGFVGVKRTDPDYHAAALLNYILGGGFVSRLNTEIRDKQGLAYYCYSQFRASYAQGPWLLRMGVNPANVEKALSSAVAQIKAMQEKPPGAAEMSLWKDYVTGRSAVAMETNAGIAEALSDAEFYGLGLDYPYRYADIMRAVTPEQVQKAAKKYLHPNAYVAAISGP